MFSNNTVHTARCVHSGGKATAGVQHTLPLLHCTGTVRLNYKYATKEDENRNIFNVTWKNVSLLNLSGQTFREYTGVIFTMDSSDPSNIDFVEIYWLYL